MLKLTLIFSVVLIVCLAAVVRLRPLDPETLHVDPTTAKRPWVPGHVLMREDGDIRSPIFPISRKVLAAKLDGIILATPRSTHLAGDISQDYATYVVRSKLWRFPDIVNVRVIAADGDASEIIILSRLVYGRSDGGVNRARVEDWLAKLSQD
ncbi:MAG: DUF1499 domain-containing protein [Litoreibacter sp.]